MSRPEPGTVVLVGLGGLSAPVGSAPKRRPAVVVSWDAFHHQRGAIVALPVSSAPVQDGFDLPLPRWREIGLRMPSKIRLGQFMLLDAETQYPVLGTLPPADLARLRYGMAAVFASA